MNANPHVYEDFPARLKRLMSEAGLNSTALAAKTCVALSTVSRYLSGEMKPTIDTLIVMADLFDVTLDYLLCRRGAVLSMHSSKDDIFIYEKNQFDFKLLVKEFDEFLASMLEENNHDETISAVISHITILLALHVRDAASINKSKYDLPEEEYFAFYVRSSEIHKLLGYLFSQLPLAVITRSGMKTKFSAINLNLKSSVKDLKELFAARPSVLHSTVTDRLILTLEQSLVQVNRQPGRPESL